MMGSRIGVASLSFGSNFPGQIYTQLKKELLPGDSFLECSMVLEKTPEHVRARLLALLDAPTRPTALVGICLRPDAATVAAYRRAKVPIVLVDEQAEGASIVASDNYAGGLLAAQHLVAAGRKHLGIVSGLTRVDGGYNATERLRGFTKGLERAGLTLAKEHDVEVMHYSRKEGVDAMSRLLDGKRPLDGVFCAAGDVCATGMLATARERGVAVPDQLALLGYDDNPVAATSALSTVRQPIERIAHEAYRLASAEAAGILDRPRKVLLEPELVVRGSTRVEVRPALTPAPRAVAGMRR
jgi:LacI family transcriptional regulator